MNNQRLGEQTLNEPTCVEQGGVGPGIEDVDHYKESDVIKDRADGSNKDNELAQFTNGPFARPLDPFCIYGITGDGDLRDIVKQVVDQDLDGQHGHKR
ncbi:hypothetical protein SDC9_133500 [bioreactor metagenome]|uniref:Uncharacterized protein n=1 Tax=bioreactor metagenome TaxID=1076179 RepID=A0A645DAT5_9ZZZZ